MNTRRTFIRAVGAWALAAGFEVHAQAAVSVHGQVYSKSQEGPVPGVTVYLAHPVLGRSAPSYSDASGNFGWKAIPPRNEPYFLEIYWGRKLLYRRQVQVRGPTALPAIYL